MKIVGVFGIFLLLCWKCLDSSMPFTSNGEKKKCLLVICVMSVRLWSEITSIIIFSFIKFLDYDIDKSFRMGNDGQKEGIRHYSRLNSLDFGHLVSISFLSNEHNNIDVCPLVFIASLLALQPDATISFS